jgi:hypothetical protein
MSFTEDWSSESIKAERKTAIIQERIPSMETNARFLHAWNSILNFHAFYLLSEWCFCHPNLYPH